MVQTKENVKKIKEKDIAIDDNKLIAESHYLENKSNTLEIVITRVEKGTVIFSKKSPIDQCRKIIIADSSSDISTGKDIMIHEICEFLEDST